MAVIADAANSAAFALDHPTMHEPCLKLIYQLAATAQTSSSVLQGLREDFNGLMGLLDTVLLQQQSQVGLTFVPVWQLSNIMAYALWLVSNT